ncbi:MAG: succinylglutamate desuccinylase/aspartoacylase family protein [Dehalococcoidia bacterium]
MSSVSRRRFIALAGSGLGAAALAGCSLTRAAEPSAAPVAARVTETPPPTPSPTPTPRPIAPRGRVPVALMKGTPYEVEGIEINSGLAGPRIMVLGGVHGNEPGGWLAAEGIADWQVSRGSLLVLPRVNWRAAAVIERTLPEIGDINRAYPGNATGMPAQQIANAIVETGRAFEPELLFDLHESWVFYNERGANGGTAFIGQTMSLGGGATEATVDRMADVVRAVNAQITAREEFYMRGASTPRPGVKVITSTPRPTPSPGVFPTSTPSATRAPGNGVTFGGTSSLSVGQWIKGCVPILIEMGQQDQAESRRAHLHQMLVRTTLEQSGML